MLEPGTRIDDRYRIVAPLGAGGMGVVYRARDEKLGRQVALKTLPPERVGDAKARARLLREARAAAALEHPGIAQVYDVGETDDGGAYLVMELVRGRSLRELMKADAIGKDGILDVVEQVAAALDRAHEQGVVHRDIKPDNVMVRDDGRAVLLDFGLAKDLGPAVADTVTPDTPTELAEEHLTKEGALIGTLSYLAPEQARGRDVGPKSDQFALATTAYEALAGRLPWDGDNTAAVLAQILVDDAPPPSSVESSLPAAVDRVFARALAKSQEDRFESAGAFAEALRRAFVETEETEGTEEAERPTAPDEALPPAPAPDARRSPWLAWATAGATTLVAVGMAASLLWPPPDDDGAQSAPAPLADDAVVGCPVLEASGVSGPTSWLGAMGADLTCRRLTLLLGGERSRTRAPAELAELPRVAGDDFPPDPWGDPSSRERTLEAARGLDAHVDGRVERTRDGDFEAELRLVREGEVLAEGRGEGRALYVAVGEAVDALADDGSLPVRDALAPTIAEHGGTSDPRAAILFEELGEASLTGVGVEERCARLAERGEAIGPLRGEVRRICARWRVEAASDLSPPPLDRSSPAALALTAPEHAEALPPDELRAIAAELAEARRGEEHPYARAVLARSEIAIWEQLGEMERARDLLLTAVEDLPRDWFLRMHLVRAMLRTPGAVAATRALAAWHPGNPEAWRALALPVMRRPERAVPWLRRAYESGGSLPLYGIYLSNALLREGRREEVRAIAARYATAGPDARLAGELLRARVEISEARFGRAHDRLTAALAELPRLGRLIDGDTDALQWLLELAEVLGREREAADPIVRRFVLAEPHRLAVDQPHYELPAIALCLHASPELARPCLSRLRELRASRAARAGRVDGAAAFLEGAERYVAEDWDGAVAAWRPVVGRLAAYLPLDAFERAGEDALRGRIARRRLARDSFAGAHPAHVAEARHAARAGDAERARELARRVIDAWSAADVPVPAVDAMRELLAELPRR